jgi:hypothetical protein
MGTEFINAHSCPTCGLRADAVTGLKDSEHPDDGALSICIRCLTVAVFETFAGHVAVRPIRPEELEAARRDPKWTETLANLDRAREDRATRRHFMAGGAA